MPDGFDETCTCVEGRIGLCGACMRGLQRESYCPRHFYWNGVCTSCGHRRETTESPHV